MDAAVEIEKPIVYDSRNLTPADQIKTPELIRLADICADVDTSLNLPQGQAISIANEQLRNRSLTEVMAILATLLVK